MGKRAKAIPDKRSPEVQEALMHLWDYIENTRPELCKHLETVDHALWVASQQEATS